MFPGGGNGNHLPHMQGYPGVQGQPFMGNGQYAGMAIQQRSAHPYSAPMNASNSLSKQLDNLIANTKWMQCTSLIDSWVSQAAYVMENGKCDLDPYVPFEMSISESGTDLSHDQTVPFDENCVQDSRTDSVEIPSSPPWRSLSEGGEISVPPLPGEMSLARSLAGLPMAAMNPKESSAEMSVPERHLKIENLAQSKKQQQTLNSPHRTTERVDDTRSSKSNNEAVERRLMPSNTTSHAHADATEATKAGVSEKQVTLGIILGKSGDEGMVIMRVKDGGIAALHGVLKVGMRVLSIDGTVLTGLSPIEMNRLIVGPEGSVAVLEILGDDGAKSLVEIGRNLGPTKSAVQNFGILKKT